MQAKVGYPEDGIAGRTLRKPLAAVTVWRQRAWIELPAVCRRWSESLRAWQGRPRAGKPPAARHADPKPSIWPKVKVRVLETVMVGWHTAGNPIASEGFDHER